MARSKAIQLLILALFVALVLCKPKKELNDDSERSEVENEQDKEKEAKKQRIETAAMKAIKKYHSESKKQEKNKVKVAKEQEQKQKTKQTRPKFVKRQPQEHYSDLVVKYALADIVERVVEVPTRTNEQAKVLLPDLYSALRESEHPMTTITTEDTKESVAIPTDLALKIAIDTATEIVELSETKAQKYLMNSALENPEDTEVGNELIKVMFAKLYGNRHKEELQKAFARIEQKMKLPLGTLFRQYKEGVVVPRLPENKQTENVLTVEEDKKKVTKSPVLENLYASINAMDLTNEQDMTEAVRLIINANMKKVSEEKEAEEKKKPTWKEFLFGK